MAVSDLARASSRQGGTRDRRLDFWRGLFLVDMVLVHLAFEGVTFGPVLGPLIVDYTRLAAGGFVFVSGLGVGLVFLPRAVEAATRRDAYVRLWRRAAYVLGIHWVTAASFVALDVARGWRTPGATTLETAADVLLLRWSPPYGDILPFYVAMLLVSPLVLELVRRGAWPVVLAASALAFAWGQHHPWALSPRVDELFPIPLWQAPFTCGLLFGAALPALDQLSRPRRGALTLAAGLAFVLLTVAANAPRLGLGASSHDFLGFVKVPLGAGECLRYLTGSLAVVLATALAWPRIADGRVTAWVGRLGARSLALYVAHVWVQALVMPLVWYDWVVGTGELLLAPLALALLTGCAWALARMPARLRWSHAFRGPVAVPAGAVAALAILVAARALEPAAPAGPAGIAASDVAPALVEPEEGAFAVVPVEEDATAGDLMLAPPDAADAPLETDEMPVLPGEEHDADEV